MSSAMPLRAVKDFYHEDKANQSRGSKINKSLKENLPTRLLKEFSSANKYYVKTIDTDSHLSSDFKQKISGYFDGQVIRDLPEQGVKILFADQNLRNQYYELRHEIFTEVDETYRKKHPEDCYDWEDYDGSEIEDDRCGRILVAVCNNKVVAGVRFLISDWIKHTANELPEVGFTMRKFFREVGLNEKARYAEMEDIVIDKSFRNRVVMKSLFSVLIEETKKFNCEYAVGVSIKSASRNHRMLFNNLGYKMDVMLDYPWMRQKNHGYETRYPVVAYFKE